MRLNPSKIINYQHIFKNCGYLHIPNYFSQAEINEYKLSINNTDLVNRLNIFVNQINNSHNFLLKTQIKKYNSNEKLYHNIDLFEKKNINYYSTVCIYPNLDYNTNIKFTNYRSYKKIKNINNEDLIDLNINKTDLLVYSSFVPYLIEDTNYNSYNFIFIDQNELY